MKVDGSVITGEIESVEFTTLATPPNVRITVNARVGKAAIPDQVLQQQCDGKGRTPVVTMVPRRYEFRFDGNQVIPLPDNPETAQSWAVPPQTSYRLK